jgi:hypothetical protein
MYISVFFISPEAGLKDIHPGEFAQAQIVISKPYPGIGYQGSGLVLERGKCPQQVDLDKPGSGMMGADITGCGIGSLHGQ